MTANTEQNYPKIKHTDTSILQYFADGEKRLKFPAGSGSNVALVLGHTGVGKSAFVQYIAGDNSKLISVEALNPQTGGTTCDYTINDTNQKIGQAILQSFTQIPELVFDEKTNTSFYDCPGFSDNRNATQDIAGSYFIKKIIERSANLKFIFVVNYASVKIGADKTDFMSLAKHVTSMIKNVDKFKNAICLVANKVNDDKSDALVLNTIAAYLTSAFKELKNKIAEAEKNQIKLPSLAQEKNILKFIEVLLAKNGENYTKIGFMRRPKESGPLIKIVAMQKHKLKLLKLLHERTMFVPNDNSADFGYTMSADSLNYIDNLIRQIHEQISNKINAIVTAIQQYYDHEVQEMENQMHSLTNSTIIFDVNRSQAQTFKDKLDAGGKITKNLVNQMNNVPMSDLSVKLYNAVGTLSISSIDVLDNISTISNLTSFAGFLQTFYNLKLPTHQWATAFSEIPTFLSTSHDRLDATATTVIHEIYRQISRKLIAIADAIKQYYDNLARRMENKINSFLITSSTAGIDTNTSQLGVKTLMDKLDKGKTAIEMLLRESDNSTVSEVMINLRNVIGNLDVQSNDITTNISSISNLENNLKFFESFKNLTFPSQYCTTTFDTIPAFLSTSSYRVRANASTVAHEITEKISRKIDAIVEAIKHYYDNLVQRIENKLNSFVTSATDTDVRVDPAEAQTFMNKFNSGRKTMENLGYEISNVVPLDLSIKLNNTIANLNIQLYGEDIGLFDNIATISRFENFLQILQAFDNSTLPVHQWSATYNSAATFFSTYSDQLRNSVANVQNQIEVGMKEKLVKSQDAIKTYFSTKEDTNTDIKKLLDEFSDQYNVVFRIRETVRNITDPVKCVRQIGDDLTTIGMSSATSVFFSVTQYENRLEYLKNLQTASDRSMNSLKCGETLDDVIRYLNDTKRWYYFLLILYDNLSKYEIQSNTEKNNDIRDRLVRLNGYEIVRDTDLRIFLQRCCQNLYLGQYDSIEHIKLNKAKLKALKNVIHITMKNDIEIQSSQPCESKLVIKRQFVKLSDITRVKCFASVKRIEIHALNTVFIDTSIDRTGEELQLYIFAPTWYIQGSHKILLDGPAENFFGFGETAINFENLIISVESKGGSRQGQIFIAITNSVSFDGISSRIMKGIIEPGATVLIDLHHTLNEYKSYLRENLIGSIRELDLKRFLDLLDHNDSIYDTLGFVYELQSLEGQFQRLYKKISFLPFYKSLLERIAVYAQNITPHRDSLEHRKVLGYLYAAINSKIYALNRVNDDFIIDIKQYFESMTADIDKWKKSNLSLQKNQLKKIYDTKINTKIEEAVKFVNTDIAQELDNISRKIDNQIRSLIDEIATRTKVAEQEREELEKQKQKLQNQLVMKGILAVFQVAGKFLAFAGPVGGLVSAVINGASMVTKALGFDKTDYGQAVDEISKLPAAVDTYTTNLKLQQSNLNNVSTKSYKEVATDVKNIVFEFIDTVQQTDANIPEINQAMAAAEENISKLEEHKKAIYDVMIPTCEVMQESVKTLGHSLSDQSLAALDITKWKMQNTIRNVQDEVRKMTEGFNVQEDIRHFIEKMEHGMATMIQVYDRIQQYREQKEFTDSVFQINSLQATKINVQNKDLSDAIDKLNLIIDSNIVLAEYEKAINAYIQYKFPFAPLLLKEFDLPSHLRLENTTANLVDQAANEIDGIIIALKKKSASIDPHRDSYKITKAKFNGNGDHLPPFYIWKYDDNRGVIAKLLQGDEITIEADITNAPINDNAVKFNEIGIRLKLGQSNDTKQLELDERLRGFSIEMLHLGNSYYRCSNKIYITPHESQRIEHSVNRNALGEYEYENEVYRKIRENEPLLSPYALWRIKIIPTSSAAHLDFSIFEEYLNQSIHLHLEGNAEYLKPSSSSSICDNELEKYYTLHKIISDDVNPLHPRNHSRRRRAIPHDNSEDIGISLNLESPENESIFAKSSSTRITSPINRAFNWLSRSLEQLKFWNSAGIIGGHTFFHHGTSSSSISSENVPNDRIKDTPSTYDKFNVNETLVLADFLIKYYTRVKPYNTNNRSIDSVQLKALTLDIMEKFETLLSDTCTRNNMPGTIFEFDPITLMAKLEKKIVNNDLAGIGAILYESINLNDYRHFDKDLFKGQIQHMIGTVLKQQNDFSPNQQSIIGYNGGGAFAGNMMRNEMNTKYDSCIGISSNIFVDLIA